MFRFDKYVLLGLGGGGGGKGKETWWREWGGGWVGGVLINEVADVGVGLCVDAMFYPFCLLHFHL